MSKYTDRSHKQLEKVLQEIDAGVVPYVEISEEAIASIVGGLYLRPMKKEALENASGVDVDIPDCLIWDIDTASL